MRFSTTPNSTMRYPRIRHSLMRYSMIFAAFAAALLIAPPAKAQVGFSINIGPPPACPYGYYPYAPYNCAPYGYYGPEWFPGGIFMGAGPWFHGPRDWHGRVDRHYDPRFGYHGGYPHRGEHDRWNNGHWAGHPHGGFHGHEMRDGHGNEYHGHGHGGDHGGDHGH